jgi:hypothetical protein
VKLQPVTSPGKSFSDIKNHANRAAIEALAERGIISGRDDGNFHPEDKITRAEFAAIVTRALGLPERVENPFTDVPASQWYVKYIATAYYYELVKGINTDGALSFNPNGNIKRQEAASLVANAAKLCGMDVARGEVEIRDTLAQFIDYRAVPDWAQAPLAFCYSEGIIDDSALEIEPLAEARRGEIAEMLYRLLDRAALFGESSQ